MYTNDMSCTQEVFANEFGTTKAIVCSCGFATTYTVLTEGADRIGMDHFRRMHEEFKTRQGLEYHLKALHLTRDSILFVDMDQINLKDLEGAKSYLPYKVLIVGMVGSPNVEAMTCEELQAILDRKKGE